MKWKDWQDGDPSHRMDLVRIDDLKRVKKRRELLPPLSELLDPSSVMVQMSHWLIERDERQK